jgi:hypothetical protein
MITIAELAKLPPLERFNRFVRQSFTVALQGGTRETDLLIGPVHRPSTSHAAFWLLSGNGRTEENGKETFSLRSRVSENELTAFPAVDALQNDEAAPQLAVSRRAIVGMHHFVATPADGQPFLLTTSAEVKELAPDRGTLVTTLEAYLQFSTGDTTEKDIVVTVHSFGLDGREKGPLFYHWMCMVEVGVVNLVGG